MNRSIIIFVSIVLVLISTKELKSQKPEKGTFGATAGLSAIAGVPTTDASTTGTLLFRYYLTDVWVARAAFNYRSVNNAGTSVIDSTQIPAQQGIPSGDGFTNRTREVSGGAYNFELGIQRNIGDIEKTEIYVGAVFLTGIDGMRRTEEYTEWLADQDAIGRVKGDYDEVVATTPIKMRYGARVVVGTNYFITPNFSIGAEFGYGFTSVVEDGGEVTLESLVGNELTAESYSADGFSETRNTFQATGAVLTLSFFF